MAPGRTGQLTTTCFYCAFTLCQALYPPPTPHLHESITDAETGVKVGHAGATLFPLLASGDFG